MTKFKRHYERVRLPEDRMLSCELVGREEVGLISVLGLGGMFIRTHETFPIGTTLEVRLSGDGQIIETQCVVRDVAPGGMGVEFTRLRGTHEDNLKKVLAARKN